MKSRAVFLRLLRAKPQSLAFSLGKPLGDQAYCLHRGLAEKRADPRLAWQAFRLMTGPGTAEASDRGTLVLAPNPPPLQPARPLPPPFGWPSSISVFSPAKLFVPPPFPLQAYEWALEGMRQLASISMEDCSSREHCSAALKCMESYKEQHPEISEARFQEAKELACQLRSSNGLKQWQFAWSKCQETKQAFEMKMEAALRTKRSLCPEGERGLPSQEGRLPSEGVAGMASSVPHCQGRPRQPSGGPRENTVGQREGVGVGEQIVLQATAPASSRSASEAPRPPYCARDEKSTLESIAEALGASPSCPSTPTSRQLFSKRILRKAQSFDLACTESLRSSCQRTLSEPARYGHTGVFIKGLEVSSTELVDRPSVARQHLSSTNWSTGCMPEERRSSASVPEARSWGR